MRRHLGAAIAPDGEHGDLFGFGRGGQRMQAAGGHLKDRADDAVGHIGIGAHRIPSGARMPSEIGLYVSGGLAARGVEKLHDGLAHILVGFDTGNGRVQLGFKPLRVEQKGGFGVGPGGRGPGLWGRGGGDRVVHLVMSRSVGLVVVLGRRRVRNRRPRSCVARGR